MEELGKMGDGSQLQVSGVVTKEEHVGEKHNSSLFKELVDGSNFIDASTS